jgi:hypothetical protein
VKGNVTEQDDFIVPLVEHRLEMPARIDREPRHQLGIGPGNTTGSIGKALPVGIFADGQQNLAHGFRDARLIHAAFLGAVILDEFMFSIDCHQFSTGLCGEIIGIAGVRRVFSDFSASRAASLIPSAPGFAGVAGVKSDEALSNPGEAGG